LAETIDYVQTHGALPAGYTSNEVSNTHDGSSLVPTIDPWQHRVPSDDGDDEGGAVIWLIVDGFMLLSDPTITDRLDYRFFVTASYATLKRRREERQGYHTLEGYWVDPPGYFDVIVWPEFLKAHRHIPGPHQLQNGKNNGGGGCERLVLIDTDVLTIPQMLDTVVDVLWP
jgi:nicotinamide/nicotinate riboside kinase